MATRAASFLNGFKNIPQEETMDWTQNNCERRILAYKKNELCLISILYIKNTNEECLVRIYTWRFIGVLIGCEAHELLMSFWRRPQMRKHCWGGKCFPVCGPRKDLLRKQYFCFLSKCFLVCVPRKHFEKHCFLVCKRLKLVTPIPGFSLSTRSVKWVRKPFVTILDLVSISSSYGHKHICC